MEALVAGPQAGITGHYALRCRLSTMRFVASLFSPVFLQREAWAWCEMSATTIGNESYQIVTKTSKWTLNERWQKTIMALRYPQTTCSAGGGLSKIICSRLHWVDRDRDPALSCYRQVIMKPALVWVYLINLHHFDGSLSLNSFRFISSYK